MQELVITTLWCYLFFSVSHKSSAHGEGEMSSHLTAAAKWKRNNTIRHKIAWEVTSPMLLTQLWKIVSFSLAAGIKWGKSFNCNKLFLLFLYLVLLSNSFDVDTNPEPNSNTSDGCEVCQHQVTWDYDGFAWDHCQRWYHTKYFSKYVQYSLLK